MSADDRDFGRLEAEVENLQREVGELRKDVKKLLACFNQAKGGWKSILLLGGVAGTLGAAAMKVASLIPWVK